MNVRGRGNDRILSFGYARSNLAAVLAPWLARLGASECPNDFPNEEINKKKKMLIDDPASD